MVGTMSPLSALPAFPAEGDCTCEFDAYELDEHGEPLNPALPVEDSWHYKRTCEFCGEVWWGLHCPHDGVQNPCPRCCEAPGGKPTPLELLYSRRTP